MNKRIRDKAWFPYAAALCVAVVLYVLLTNFTSVMKALGAFLGFFNPLFLGCVLAYLMNPLAKLLSGTVFKGLKKDSLRWGLSIGMTIVIFVVILQFLLGTLVPQLAGSISALLNNMDGYLAALNSLVERLGIASFLNLDQMVMPSGDMVSTVISFLKDNNDKILSFSTAAGKTVINWLISFVLSIYLLASKEGLKRDSLRLLRALTSPEKCARTVSFFARCDEILSRYIIFTLLDALIVGGVTAIFMVCFGMEYAGLVALVAGLTNLIPTFGPVIGYIVGGFILLLVNPFHALIYILFAFVLQLLDGYVIKPKLFGNSLGVSGLLILAAVIVCGNMFGILGMLLAIPLAAILDFIYREELLPALERRRGVTE